MSWKAHYLIHIYGYSQGAKATSCRLVKLVDEDGVVLSTGDLTYAYITQWTTKLNSSVPVTKHISAYNQDGIPKTVELTFDRFETSSPWEVGWPVDDDGRDLGFRKHMNLYNELDVGFSGLWLLKRRYRRKDIAKITRSVGIVRAGHDSNDIGYMLLVARVDASEGTHSL